MANDLITNLYAKGISSLDMLILSHHDNDHDGAWRELLKFVSTPLILVGQPEYYATNKVSKINFCSSAQAWDWDGVHFELLTPYTNRDKVSENNRSCVLRVVTKNSALLVTGDISNRGERELVTRYKDRLYSNILVLGHHGSKTSNSELFLDTVEPKFAIVSAGYHNNFHHPHKDIVTSLAKRGIELFRTDEQGAI